MLAVSDLSIQRARSVASFEKLATNQALSAFSSGGYGHDMIHMQKQSRIRRGRISFKESAITADIRVVEFTFEGKRGELNDGEALGLTGFTTG